MQKRSDSCSDKTFDVMRVGFSKAHNDAICDAALFEQRLEDNLENPKHLALNMECDTNPFENV